MNYKSGIVCMYNIFSPSLFDSGIKLYDTRNCYILEAVLVLIYKCKTIFLTVTTQTHVSVLYFSGFKS